MANDKIDILNGGSISEEEVTQREKVGKGLWGLYYEKREKINDTRLRRSLSEQAQEKSIVPPYDLLKDILSLETYKTLIKSQKNL